MTLLRKKPQQMAVILEKKSIKDLDLKLLELLLLEVQG
jgi:hypothetical protein